MLEKGSSLILRYVAAPVCNRELRVRKTRKGETQTRLCEVDFGAHSQACNLCLSGYFPKHVNWNEM